MIKSKSFYKIPLFITIVVFICSICIDDYSNVYQKPIKGDAHGYYAYLPAIFIHQDLSFGFIDEVYEKQYGGKNGKSFLVHQDDYSVNKTFPGVALLYLPFFLIAHGLTYLAGLPLDGYSVMYQYAFVIGKLSYLFLGLLALAKLLQGFSFSRSSINWAMLLVVFGSNLFFYAVMDHSVTHVYSFFIVNCLLYFLFRFREDGQDKHLLISIGLLALLGIVRPTNVIVLLFLPIFFSDKHFYIQAAKRLMTRKNGWKTSLIVSALFSIPFILWKLQTNHWMVYSYGDEGFNFRDPQWFKFLFSYIKGWWTYTPLAAVLILIGVVTLWKKDKKRLGWLLLFLGVAVYVYSSWWCWYYGAGMGQRVMIDFYAVLALLYVIIVRETSKNRLIQYGFHTLLVLLMGLNIFQTFQIRYGVFTFGSATKTQYWDNFLRLDQPPKVYPFDHWEIRKKIAIDLSMNSSAIMKGKSILVDGDTLLQVTKWDHYSATIQTSLQDVEEGSKIAISFKARARELGSNIKLMTFTGNNFVEPYQSFQFNKWLELHEWVDLEFLIEPNSEWQGSLSFYFWNAAEGQKIEFKNINIIHYYSDEYF